MADTKTAVKPVPAPAESVTLKPEAIEVKRAVSPDAEHLPPYHTAETAKIAEKNQKAADKDKDAPYEFSANGYTVEEKDAADRVASPNGKVYEVTHAGDKEFTKTFTDKRAAEIFAETHAPRVVA